MVQKHLKNEKKLTGDGDLGGWDEKPIDCRILFAVSLTSVIFASLAIEGSRAASCCSAVVWPSKSSNFESASKKAKL